MKSRGARTLSLAPAILLVLALPQSGCKWISRQVAEKVIGEVPVTDGKDTKGGISVGKPVEIPSDFPKHFIPYPDAARIGILSGPDLHSLTMLTTDEPNKVHVFYDDKLKPLGFVRVSLTLQNGTRTDTYKHADGRLLFVATSTSKMAPAAEPSERKTMIMLDDRAKT